jgi:hypothetical protein
MPSDASQPISDHGQERDHDDVSQFCVRGSLTELVVDGGESLTGGVHPILICSPCKHREEIEDVEEQVLVGSGHGMDEPFVGDYYFLVVTVVLS